MSLDALKKAVRALEREEARLGALIAAHKPDEVILTGQIHDHAARLRSFEIASEVMQSL